MDENLKDVPTVIDNVTEATNATAKTPATPEGMAVAYGSLILMALFPILVGSFRAVTHHARQKVRTVP